jgi:aspartyl-tRNA(Asn)/glutamyl-tRNA(Gln) amidotransferase subunit A
MSLATKSISSLRKLLITGEIKPSEIIEDLAKNISVNEDKIGAFISLDLDSAKCQANAADLSKPLGGIPIAIKDNINVIGEPCTCGSKILSKNYTSPYDATSIKNLRHAGAVLFGRTNMDEFAMGSATENSTLKITNNPAAPGHIPGGSSGGSAAAVAANFAPAALGSDTGGSIRQPASHCGVVGLKPSYGRISRYGLVAFASSLDQMGPITRNVEDAALLLQALCGHDVLDSTSLPIDVPNFSTNLTKGVKGLRIGIPKEYFAAGLDPTVRAATEKAIVQLTEEGHTLNTRLQLITLSHQQKLHQTYHVSMEFVMVAAQKVLKIFYLSTNFHAKKDLEQK